MPTPHLVTIKTIWGERHEGYKTVVYSTPLPSPDVCNSLDTEYYMKLSQLYAQHDAQYLFRRRGERADDTRLFWRRHVRAAGTELYLRLAQRLLIGVENYGVGFREHQVGAEHANKPNSAQVGVDKLVVGMVRTQANDNLVTDSDACAAALACDVKPSIAVYEDDHPVASALYCAQMLNCNSEIKFAAQQIGYTNPFGAYLSSSLGSGRRQYLRKKDGGKPIDGYSATFSGSVGSSHQALAAKAGIHWSTTSHTSVDIDLYDAAGGGGGKATGC
ncbi:hypothetical protein G3M48_009520 [Beauveria asiatica]|uniref:Uncharacterized protein n=1 Tax=Beauveria asiatica TaxID=1069075 RepID=A0AAW0S3E5_9HYPO